MKHLANILRLSALVLLCGCVGLAEEGNTAGPASGPPQRLNIAGNWQFSTTSAVLMSRATIAGSITQPRSSVRGAVHVKGSRCFDYLTTIGLTGTLTGRNLSLTSTSVDGQVITLAGTIRDDAVNGIASAFTGRYATDGGCANGDHGNVIGIRIPPIANNVNGTFKSSGGETFDVVGQWGQYGSASPEGSFGIAGIATFSTPCFSSGTFKRGVFPSGSFIIGNSVALEIKTGNGTITYLGTLSRDRTRIGGAYTVSGGSCDDTGKAVLVVSSPWDY
jgi:hypothetical protein